MGAINSDGLELGMRNTQITSNDIRESAFLFQHLSVLIQRYNAVASQGTFPTQPLRTIIIGRSSLFAFSFCF